MVDPAVADVQCVKCDRYCINPDYHGTHAMRHNPIYAFRCYYCGRFFCGECGEEHFGEPHN